MADNALVAPSQNGFLDTINQLTATLSSAASGAANAYSTFVGARTTESLAKLQAGGYALQPTQSELNAIAAKRATAQNYIMYAAVGLAILGTAALIYKSVK